MSELIPFECGAKVEISSPLLVSKVIADHRMFCHHCPPDCPRPTVKHAVWESRVAEALTRLGETL